ncbi:MAG TPA: MFS transporter [Chitinophagaceae bacterium]|nr:MFS transporter [Chitinophagaceae bacterium]
MNDYSPRRRRIHIGAIFFFYGLSYASWASRIPSIQQNLHLSEAALGAVLLGMPAGSFITVPFTGYLIAKKGSRKVVIASSLLYTATLAAIGLSHTVAQLVISLFLFGSFGNMLNISVNTQAIGVEAIYGRRILSSFHALWSTAGIAGAAIGTYMLGRGVSTAAHLGGISAWGFISMLICLPYLLHEDINADKKRRVFVLPGKGMIILGLIAFCSMMCQGAMFDWSGVYFKKVMTVNKEWIGAGYTAFTVSMALVRFVTDKITHHSGLKKILFYSGIITAAGLLLCVCMPYLVPAIIGCMLAGIGVSPAVPLVFSAAGKTKGMSPGVAIAAVSTLGFIGLLIGPVLIGFIAGATSLKVSFVVIAVIGLIFSALSLKIKEE